MASNTNTYTSSTTNYHYISFSGKWREEAMNENPGVLIINVQAYFHAALSMVNAFLYDVCATIFCNENFKFQFTNHRSGLSRSAVFLMMFMVSRDFEI